MALASVVDAVIFSNDEPLIKATREQLQIKSVTNIIATDDVAECLENLSRFPRGLFILDWDLGPEHCVKILKNAVNKTGLAFRPLIIACRELDQVIVPIALEYGVTQIHMGGPNGKLLATNIGNALRRFSVRSEYKTDIDRIAKMRAAGDWKGIITILSSLYNANKDNATIKAELAEAFFQIGQYKEALKILTPVTESSPPNTRYLHIYGRCLLKLGIYSEAEAAFSKVSLFNPFDPDKLIGLGNALLKLGKLSRAEDAFDQALELDEKNGEALLGKGQLRLMDGDVNEALQLVENIANPQELASMFNSAAILLIRKKRFSDGMKLYHAAIRTLGSDPLLKSRLFFNMGVGHRRQKNPNAALACFRQAMELDPSYVTAKNNFSAMEEVIAKKYKSSAEIGDFSSPNQDSNQDLLFTPMVPAQEATGSNADMMFDVADDFAEELSISDSDLNDLIKEEKVG